MHLTTSAARLLHVGAIALATVVLGGLSPVHAQNTCDIFVDTNASGQEDGSPANPYSNLQDGLDDAGTGDVVCAAEGTYNTSGSPFSMLAGTSLIGGYSGDFDTQDANANPTVLDGGGAERVLVISSSGTSTLVEGVTIQNGQAGSGGGLRFSNYSSDILTIRNSVFSGNEATSNQGGAVEAVGINSLSFTDVEFTGNTASSNGGAIRTENVNDVTATTVSLIGNEAQGGDGGALYFSNGNNATLKNILAKGNRASGKGGAFYLTGSQLSLVNATVSGNYAGNRGGAVAIPPESGSEVVNSIVWGNDAGGGYPQFAFRGGGSGMTFQNSDLQGSGGSDAWNTGYGDTCNCAVSNDGGGNLDQNPFFDASVDPSAAPTESGDLHVQEGSPTVDSGLNSAASGLTFDVEGDSRIQPQNGTVDMGGYEGAVPVPAPSVMYVDKSSGSDGNDGSSWADAIKNLRTAITRADGGTEIWVAQGVYYPDEGQGASNNTATSSFSLKNRVAVYGGFAGDETDRAQRDPSSNTVILSGDLEQNDTNSGDVVTSPSSEISGTNAYHVVMAEGVYSRSELHGVTITAGNATSSADVSDGGGVYVDDGSPTLANVRIVGNRSDQEGGGLATTSGKGPLLKYATIEFNAAGQHGGGISVTNSYLRLISSTVAGNTAQSNGGGVHSDLPQSSFLSNVVLMGNNAQGDGGGIYTLGDWNSNQGPRTLNIQSSTINGNSAGGSGGAIRGEENGIVNIENSILYGDSGSEITTNNLTVNVQNALIEGGSYGDVNGSPGFISSVDPSAAPTTSGDLHLQPTSDAIGAGDKSLRASDVADIDEDNDVSEPMPLDRSGAPRVRDGEIDLGAYEGSSASLTVMGTPGAGGADAGWRDIGVPVTGSSGTAISVTDVERGTGTGLENLSRWGVWRYVNDSWTRLNDSDPLPAGRGFTVYLFDEGASAIDPSLSLETTAGSVIGDNDVTVGDGSPSGDAPLSQTATWHLLANPYGVPYDLAELNGTTNFAEFQAVVQVWDVEAGGYETINLDPIPPSSGKTGVTAWQAFFAERGPSSNATELTFPSEGRLPALSNTHPFFGSKSKERAAESTLIDLKVVAKTSEGEEIMRDEAASLLFHTGASAGWDRYDATKLTPPTSQYAVMGPVGTGRDTSLSMKAQESRPFPSVEDVEIPLGLEVKNYDGPLVVSLSDVVNVPESWTVKLVDTKGTADPGDDEEHLLQVGGDGYEFTSATSKQDGAVEKTEQEGKEGPSHPKPIDWTPLRSLESTNPRAKASDDEDPPARFELRVTTDDGALPVEMEGMNATVKGDAVQLKWQTASETGNAGFYVEHQRAVEGDSTAQDGAWSSLGFVEGAETTDRPQQYQYKAEQLKYGTHLFRLRQVDIDGTVHRTEPISVDMGIKDNVVLDGPNPNPVRNQGRLDLTVRSEQEVTVQLYDVLGRRVRSIDHGTVPEQETHRVQFNTKDLSSGTYFLRVIGDDFQETEKMTIVR